MRPTIVIYQNPDHVAGILQQLHAAPLVTNESRERNEDARPLELVNPPGNVEELAGLDDFAQAAGPNVFAKNAQIAVSGFGSNTRTIQNFTYSQAYYLLYVREALKRKRLVRTITSAEGAKDLESGEFVEFHASFRPNAIHALLDILTPELIGGIVEHNVKNQGLTTFPEYSSIDDVKIFAEGLFMRAKVKSDIARAAAKAVRVDFRAEKTREFYASVSDVTAITICDSNNFVVDDEDRILDGTYTVLGKATSRIENDLPVLSRNKLLDRLGPELVDSIFNMILEGAATQANKMKLGNGEERALGDVIDFKFPSRIDGPSFKVIPIAIYV